MKWREQKNFLLRFGLGRQRAESSAFGQGGKIFRFGTNKNNLDKHTIAHIIIIAPRRPTNTVKKREAHDEEEERLIKSNNTQYSIESVNEPFKKKSSNSPPTLCCCFCRVLSSNTPNLTVRFPTGPGQTHIIRHCSPSARRGRRVRVV